MSSKEIIRYIEGYIARINIKGVIIDDDKKELIINDLTQKINLLIDTINKEIKTKQTKDVQKQEDIEDRKNFILQNIGNLKDYINGKETKTISNIEYVILKHDAKLNNLDHSNQYYEVFQILYDKNSSALYTYYIVSGTKVSINYLPELLDSTISSEYRRLFDELYNDIDLLVKQPTQVKKTNMVDIFKGLFRSSIKVAPSQPSSSGGKKVSTAYKSTGDKVHLFIDNKKLHRSIYVKGNGKAKYCKINNEFVLLSKLKNKVIE
jgi:hypothetical protein